MEDGFRRSIQPVARLLSRLNVSPNALTLLGWALSLASAVMFALGDLRLAGAMMLVGGVFDALDGDVARESDLSTPFGAFLDSTLDRVSEAAVFCGIVFYFASESPSLALLAAAAMTFSLLTSYTRARAEGLGVSCEVGLLERAGRVLILSLTAMLGLLTLGLALISAGALITTAQRILHVRRQTNSD